MKRWLDKRPRLRLWLGRTFKAMLVLAIVGAPVWYHEEIIERFVSSSSMEVTLSGIRLGNPIRVDYIGLRDRDDARAPVFFVGVGASIELASLVGERRVSKLTFDSVTINATDAPARNFDFLVEMLTAESSDTSLTNIPEQIAFPNVSVTYESPTGGLRLDGLALDGKIEALDGMQFSLSGDAVSGSFRDDTRGGAKQDIAGSLESGITMSKGEVAASFNAALPGLAELALSSTVKTSPALDATVTLEPATLSSGIWAELLSAQAGYPIRFDAAKISGGSVHITSGEAGMVANAFSIEASADPVSLGPVDAPQFTGPLQVRLTGGGAQGLSGNAEIRLGDAAPLNLTLTPGEGGFAVALDAVEWKRSELEALLPAPMNGFISYWPALQAAGLSGTFSTVNGATTLTATLSPSTPSSTKPDVAISIQMPKDAPMIVTAKGAMKNAGDWSLDYAASEAPGKATLNLNRADATRWISEVLGFPFPLEGVTLNGKGDFAADGSSIDADITANQGDTKLGEFKVSKGAVEAGAVVLPLKLTTDLAAFAPIFADSGLAGKAEASGAVKLTGAQAQVDKLSAAVRGLAMNGSSLPDDPPLKITGSAARDNKSGVSTGSLKAAWGDTDSAEATKFSINTDASAWSMQQVQVAGTSDFFVGIGLIESGDFTLGLTGEQLAFKDGAYSGTATGTLLGGLVLPEGLLAAKELNAVMKSDFTQGLSASGPVSAGELAALGVILSNVKADVSIRGPLVFFTNVTTQVFGGTATGSGNADLAAEGFPVTLDTTITNADLAQFTTEFQPPNIKLTGLISGTIRASMAGEDITDLDVNLISGEGFTLNRDMVAQVLMSHQIGELAGSALVDKVVKQVIGDDDARPFTGAELRLGLEGGRITGEALLKSGSLNLTVDIRADQAALFEALRMRQEGQIAGFSTEFN